VICIKLVALSFSNLKWHFPPSTFILHISIILRKKHVMSEGKIFGANNMNNILISVFGLSTVGQ